MEIDKTYTFFALAKANYLLDDYIRHCILGTSCYEDINSQEAVILNEFSIAALNIMSTKEDIIEKKDKYKDNLLISVMSEAADVLANRCEDGSYEIDGIKFEDPANLVSRIRNKIAHGDYTIDLASKSVVFNFDNNQASIEIEKIVFLSHYLVMKRYEYRKVSDYDRTISIYLEPSFNPINNHIKTDKDLDEFLDYFKVVNFNITTTEEYIPKEAYVEFERIKQALNLMLGNMTISRKTDTLSLLKKKINPLTTSFNRKYNNVKLDTNIQVLSPDQKEEIKKIIKGTLAYKDINTKYLAPLVSEYVIRIINDSFNSSFVIDNSITLNRLLESMLKLDTTDIETIAYDVAKKNKQVTINQDTLCVTLLYKFLTLSYGYVNDLFTIDDLDFSLIQPTVNEIVDKEFVNISEQVESDNRKLQSTKKKLSDLTQTYMGVSKHGSKEVKKDKLKVIRSNIGSTTKRLLSLYKLSLLHNREYKGMAHDRKVNPKYYENKKIIEGIRNALSHGYIKVYPTDNLTTSIIALTDYHKGKKVFELKCSYQDMQTTIDNIYNNIYSNSDIFKYERIRIK